MAKQASEKVEMVEVIFSLIGERGAPVPVPALLWRRSRGLGTQPA